MWLYLVLFCYYVYQRVEMLLQTSVFSAGLAQSADYGPYGFFLQQKTASRRPAVQPFVLGELSALRMQGTTANPLGFMQVRCYLRAAWYFFVFSIRATL